MTTQSCGGGALGQEGATGWGCRGRGGKADSSGIKWSRAQRHRIPAAAVQGSEQGARSISTSSLNNNKLLPRQQDPAGVLQTARIIPY